MDAASKIKRVLVASIATWVIATPISLIADEPPTDGAAPKACCADGKACAANGNANCAESKSCCADGKTDSKACCSDGKACCADSKACCADGKCSDTVETASTTASEPCLATLTCTAEAKGTSCPDCEPNTSTATSLGLLSDWLMKRPRFSAQVAIHFGTGDESAVLAEDTASPCPKIQTATLTLDGCDAKLTTSPTRVQLIPQIAKPMRFLEGVSHLKIGEVTVCGHRICTGTKCYDVEDGPVESSKCDANGNAAEEEPILVVPMAPPLPRYYESAASEQAPTTNDSVDVVEKALANTHLTLPASTVVELLVAKTELMTRLELNEQMMQERQQSAQTVQFLTERNAKLETQVAVAEARQRMTEALTASLIERAELAVKLATVDNKPATQHSETVSSVKSIQEDLSNIRRQIALLKRGSPVPFAVSSVGTGNPTAFGREVPAMKNPVPMATRIPRIPYDTTPYIPTAQLIHPAEAGSPEQASADATPSPSDATTESTETVVK